MAGRLPIRFTELCQLTQLGVLPQSIGFASTTQESDHYVCVRQKADETANPEVIIVDLKNGNSVMRRPIKAGKSPSDQHDPASHPNTSI